MRGVHRLLPVVIVDEAHLLDREMLEEVRFLLNFKMDAESPMTLVLVGQSELWDRLQLQAYAAIKQRIDLQCRLRIMIALKLVNTSQGTWNMPVQPKTSSPMEQLMRSTDSPAAPPGSSIKSVQIAFCMVHRTRRKLLMIIW
jgi:hypothetical protein